MCKTTRTRSYLPALRHGHPRAQYDFYCEFFDCARNAAWSNLDDDDRTESVDFGFTKIFRRAKKKLLTDLTGRYVHGAVDMESRLIWLRKQRRAPMIPLPCEVPDVVSPQDEVEEADVLETTFCAAGLTEVEKEIVRLRVLDRMPWKMISERLGLPESTVRRHFRNALDKLRRWYERKQWTEDDDASEGPEDQPNDADDGGCVQ